MWPFTRKAPPPSASKGVVLTDQSLEAGGVAFCVRQLTASDHHNRYKAARVLEKIGDETALVPLLAAAREFDKADEESKVNIFAASAVARLVERGQADVEVVASAVLGPELPAAPERWGRGCLVTELGALDVKAAGRDLTDAVIGILERVVASDGERGGARAALDRIMKARDASPL
jgi:hypothetical protein